MTKTVKRFINLEEIFGQVDSDVIQYDEEGIGWIIDILSITRGVHSWDNEIREHNGLGLLIEVEYDKRLTDLDTIKAFIVERLENIEETIAYLQAVDIHYDAYADED